MRCTSRLLAAFALLIPVTTASAQAIIAQPTGLTNPAHVIDFGANLYPNFTNVTTQFAGITLTHTAYFTTGTYLNLVGGFLTNNGAGQPNTLKIKFASPISDLSFAYHQVGTQNPSAFRAMLGAVTVDSFSLLWNQTQSNNYFGFTNIVFDELQIDFDGDFNLDTLAFNDANASPPLAYCTAGTTTHGCNASISASANPSVSLANACNITVANVEGQKSGIVFYGINNTGFTPGPWALGSTSFLCVKHPSQRTPLQTSGGTVDVCNGSMALDWNAFQSTHPTALGNPWSVGAKVFVQAWFRDPPAAKATNLSNAVEMTYQP